MWCSFYSALFLYFFSCNEVLHSFPEDGSPYSSLSPPLCVMPHSFNIHFTYLHIILSLWHAPAHGISQYHTLLSVCRQEAVQIHHGHSWWFWRLFLGCVSAGKAGSGAGPACSEGNLCLLERCWLCLEHVTNSCTEGSKGLWEGFHKGAQSHGNWTHMSLSFILWG